MAKLNAFKTKQELQQKQQRERDERDQRIMSEINARKKLLKSIWGNRPPVDPGGTFGKFVHTTTLKEDAIAWEMFWNYFFNLFELLFQAQYFIQVIEYDKAQELGIAYDENDPTIKIYHSDPNTGELDLSQTYEPGEAPDYAIRANGYCPPPNYKRALENQMARYMVDMYGEQSLSPSQRDQLYGAFERLGNDMAKRRDLASDRMAIAKPPTPKTK